MAISQKHLGRWLERHRIQQQYRSARVDEEGSPQDNYLSTKHRTAALSRRHFGKVGLLHPSGSIYRWAILILASSLLTTAYFADESIPTTVPYLKSQYNLNSQQIAMLYSASFVPNLIMTTLGGILIDKYGTNRMSLLYSTFLLFGTVIFALSPNYYGKMVGRVIFGLGFEPLEVTQDTILTRWFFDDAEISTSPSLTFSYGFSFAMGQLGQLVGTNTLPVLGGINLTFCYLVVCASSLFATLTNLFLIFLDTRAAPILKLDSAKSEEEEGFSLKNYKKLPRKYWMLCFITCLGYTVILVFMAFATDLQHTKYKVTVDAAGHVNSTVYALSIILSPVLGYLLDKYGKLLYVMGFGSVCLVSGLVLIGMTDVQPYIPLGLIGIAYAALPNAIWPCVSLVCGDESAGTAFGGVTALNSVGYTPLCLCLAGLASIGLVIEVALIIMDWMDGGWLNDGKPNPHLVVDKSLGKLPLLGSRKSNYGSSRSSSSRNSNYKSSKSSVN